MTGFWKLRILLTTLLLPLSALVTRSLGAKLALDRPSVPQLCHCVNSTSPLPYRPHLIFFIGEKF